MKNNYQPIFYILFVLALVVNFWGINTGFFTDDPGLYASISKNLLYHKEFLQLYSYQLDWLDKPHFPFWMVLLSFKLFGISVWAYRLPGLLFFLLSLLYTFLFSKKYYGSEIACMAVLILATSQHVIMSNTDLRAEPYLMALVIGSIYHISLLRERYTFIQLFLAALLTACAIMTKGIFVLVAIGGALMGQLIIQKKYKEMIQWKWIALLVLTTLFIIPELYALYIQFDLHPEKTVFYNHNVSGIKWFIWDSQFGRFINSGPITRKSGSIIFYLHTLLWAYAPWCLVFYYAVYKSIKEIWGRHKLPEYYALSGGLSLLLLFSLSRFQLPFYTNTVYPLFAIVTAPFCYNQLSRIGNSLRLVGQWLYIIILPLIILIIYFLSKPDQVLFFLCDCIIFLLLLLLIFNIKSKPHLRVFYCNCAAVLFANFYLGAIFYHELTNYNGQIKAADYLNQNAFDNYRIYSLTPGNNVFQFYNKRPVELAGIDSFERSVPLPNSIFYVTHKTRDELLQNHFDFKVLKSFQNYPQENILPAFISRSTRNSVLDSVYLITK